MPKVARREVLIHSYKVIDETSVTVPQLSAAERGHMLTHGTRGGRGRAPPRLDLVFDADLITSRRTLMSPVPEVGKGGMGTGTRRIKKKKKNTVKEG